ncbi:neuroendocrine protein 7B2-like [Ylistrum balloti]|uniref:neuroendocrine protein 7B2-like n=1 Tax=Ylistrum balloti TaxID=509963 RepID=UPI002905BB8D|nr:neuroendocrine protein 7B2-like [Ylistrum balloti]
MVPLLLIAVLGLVNGASYSDILSELNGLYDLDPGYYDDNLVSRSSPGDWGLSYRDATLNDPELLGEAALRDQEYLEQSPLWGYQSMSGGTGGGKENPKEVKTDKVLPAYCNPPNPCPIGYTADDNCVETFANTPENNRNLMKEQDCPCDSEHMLSCPNDKGRINTQAQSTDDISNMLQGIDLTNSVDDNPYFGSTEDRISRVAKKSPHMIKKRTPEEFTGAARFEGPARLAKKSTGDYQKQQIFQDLLEEY